jgi:hypothetical protein
MTWYHDANGDSFVAQHQNKWEQSFIKRIQDIERQQAERSTKLDRQFAALQHDLAKNLWQSIFVILSLVGIIWIFTRLAKYIWSLANQALYPGTEQPFSSGVQRTPDGRICRFPMKISAAFLLFHVQLEDFIKEELKPEAKRLDRVYTKLQARAQNHLSDTKPSEALDNKQDHDIRPIPKVSNRASDVARRRDEMHQAIDDAQKLLGQLAETIQNKSSPEKLLLAAQDFLESSVITSQDHKPLAGANRKKIMRTWLELTQLIAAHGSVST